MVSFPPCLVLFEAHTKQCSATYVQLSPAAACVFTPALLLSPLAYLAHESPLPQAVENATLVARLGHIRDRLVVPTMDPYCC